MTTPSPLTQKSKNRVKSMIGLLGVGEKIDLGRPHAKGYRLTVGRTVTGTQARFWLGQHEGEAQQRAQAVVAVWADMASSGITLWTPDLIAMAKGLGEEKVTALRKFAAVLRSDLAHRENGLTSFRNRISDIVDIPSVSPAGASQMPPDAKPEPMLYEAMTAYEKSLASKRVSPGHRSQVKQVLARVRKHQPDVPMSAVDFALLDKLADFWKARPAMKNGNPIAPDTVLITLRTCRAFFTWLDDTSWSGWEGPRKLTRPFSCEKKDLMTPAEVRASATIEQFTVADLVKLYKAGNDRDRVVMLTALFSAGTQQELAVMTKAEFDLNAGTLDHYRNKTSIRGLFWLPPELVKLLRAEVKQHADKPLAFYTREGNPLVLFDGDKKLSDSVLQLWSRLKIKAELPDALPFKFLRKFAGDYATRAGGESLGQAMLSHAPTSILGKHYTTTRDFAALHVAQKAMHAEFVAAGMFDSKPSPKQSPK